MWSSDSELAAASSSSSSSTTSASSPPPSPPPAASLLRRPRNRRRRRANRQIVHSGAAAAANAAPGAHEPEAEDMWRGAQWEAAWPGRRDARPVLLASDGGGAGQDDGVGRSRSLTDDDLEELKGCADLGFGFSYDEIPELRGTLPALELCYSMSQRLLDDKHHQADSAPDAAFAAATPATPPVTNWKISSPGDSPDEVKARLKYWAQAVACTVRLCS
ncbi:hypothetical protein SEVIR_3G094300v4 [Setaria viridis]|nr:uncharacterized protein LOC101761324 [Setaria italica]XP_034583959.1 uncharacterized protein LOC117846944 [Setaria viridis]TKW25095.1 hypothetical protein SEVIR_3G094300v2 [Setaria viridis]